MIKTMLYFGSFNPIHVGHLAIANYALLESLVDELWFVVSPQNPFKSEDSLLSERKRLEMINIAIKNSGLADAIKASDVEFYLPKPSFTINTIRKLREEFPTREFSIIMGEDNLAEIKMWKDYEQILTFCKVFVYIRSEAYVCEELKRLPNIEILKNAPLLDISSTQLRKYLNQGKCVSTLLPCGVYEYIVNNNLYKTDDNDR